MAQVTIHHEAGVTVEVFSGSPPVDQSATVADQALQIAALQADKLKLIADNAVAAQEAAAAMERVIAQRDELAAKITAFKSASAALMV